MALFDPYGDIRETKNRLPHWQQIGATYFVTFRLTDSLPKELLDRWKEDRAQWLKWHPQPWTPEVEAEFHQRFSSTTERWLDAAHGECLLRRPECAEIVGECLAHFDGERCHQIAWVVMPNHVHVLVAPISPEPLERLIHSWKSFSAKRINASLSSGGAVWQRDYFDRLIRNEEHLARCVRYIRNNPPKARLGSGEYLLYQSELAKALPEQSGSL